MIATLALLSFLTAPRALAADLPVAVTVKLSTEAASLHMDDYYFDPILKRVVVPGGQLGKIFLIDPDSREISSLDVVAPPKNDTGTAGGFTSADGGEGLIFATNRSDRKLYVTDPAETDAQKRVIASAPLAASPDFVRYVSSTREVWVTEPKKNQIEVFSLSVSTAMRPITPVQETLITSTHGEYESLLVDTRRKRAYSNQEGSTVAIDLQSKKVVETWKNGCKESTGLALDDGRGFLLVACREGKAVVLDLKDGRQISSLKTGDGLDIIAYSEAKQTVYLPAAKAETLTFAALTDKGELQARGKSATVKGAHCVAVDKTGGAWVCDGAKASLLYFTPLED